MGSQLNSAPKPSILDNMENLIALSKKLENVYNNRPDISTFEGAMYGTNQENRYTKDAIKKDENYVEYRRNEIEKINHSKGMDVAERLEGGFQLSEIMQAMIVDRMNKNWFKDCKAIMTSDYDDLAVGIDAVMKHERGGYLGASFDFTLTNKDMMVDKKLNKEWENIKEGRVATVKYFEDPDTGKKGKLMVPKFIIGASKKDIEELAEAYLKNDNKVLENHPFKYVMLQQIEVQLNTVLEFYESNMDNEKYKFAKEQYDKVYKFLRIMKTDIHADDKMHDTDLHEYSKSNVALDMMKRFQIMKDRPKP